MNKKNVPKLRQEVKVKNDIVTSNDIKICYTEKFQDFTARYIINFNNSVKIWNVVCKCFQFVYMQVIHFMWYGRFRSLPHNVDISRFSE